MLRLAKGSAKPNTTPAVDWLDGLIGPGGLLLLMSQVTVSVLWVRLRKSY
jgi:hypothetical protein